MTVTYFASWFKQLSSQPESHLLVFCLPHGGAGASAFSGWEDVLPRALELVAVRLPGREQRVTESPGFDPAEIASAIAARADRPYAIFGHSLGARLGFEVIRELRRRSMGLPRLFYVAAARPPDADDPIAHVADFDDERFISSLIDLIDAPSQLRDQPELRELYLPILRSDLAWLRGLAYRPEPPIAVPIVAMAGAADTLYDPAVMLGWGSHTSASFRLHTLPGGHFFPQARAQQVVRFLAADLLTGTEGSPAPLPEEAL